MLRFLRGERRAHDAAEQKSNHHQHLVAVLIDRWRAEVPRILSDLDET